ncbi:MAG: hypothetical protein RLZZ501_271 [Pseudomonadota bacterium]|jgi:hypothetical protein
MTAHRRAAVTRTADAAADLWQTLEAGTLHFAVRWRQGDVPVSLSLEDGRLVARYVDRAGQVAASSNYELAALCLSAGRLISLSGWLRWTGSLFRAQAVGRGVARRGGHVRHGFASAEAESLAKASALSGRRRAGAGAVKKSCFSCRHLGPGCAGPAAAPENRLCPSADLESWLPLTATIMEEGR